MPENRYSPDHDPYDGYADYAEDTRKEVAAGSLSVLVACNRDVPQSIWKAFSLIQTFITIAFGWSVASILLHLMTRSVHSEVGFGGLLFLLGTLIIGFITGIFFWIITEVLLHRSPQFSTLLILDFVAVIIVLIALAQPSRHSNNITNRYAVAAIPETKAVPEPIPAPRHKAQKKVLGVDYGSPPGVVPPMLEVNDQGRVVVITNKGTYPLFIGIARVRRNAALPDGWEGCRMSPPNGTALSLRWDQFSNGVRFAYQILPGDQLAFALHEECADRFYDASIEYRIGAQHEPNSWWSDSALHAKVLDYQLDSEPTDE